MVLFYEDTATGETKMSDVSLSTNQNTHYPCPFCHCLFLNPTDLQRHLYTYSYKQTVNRPRINREDHQRLWNEDLKRR